jgi:hypothetical protein
MDHEVLNRPDNPRMWCLVSNPLPYINANLQEIHTKNATAQNIINGFAEATPMLGDIWGYLAEALNDVPALSAEITRLADALHGARLDRANLIAAARAAIAADHEHERDPLSYLRDELDALTSPPERNGGHL